MRIAGEGPRYEPIPVPLDPSPGSPSPGASAGPSFKSVLHGLGKTIDQGEALIARSSRGGFGGLDSAQLIALQSRIYHYSEAVDLSAKLVDRATTAVRTVLSPH